MFVFVADVFDDQYTGGAELSLGALIKSSKLPITRISSHILTPKMMKNTQNAFWIFGNFCNLSEACMLYAAQNLNYSVIEFDYKFCKYRTTHLHKAVEGEECDCVASKHAKLVAIFLKESKINWWMSEGQCQIYLEKFPFLEEGRNVVLSSIFYEDTLEKLKSLSDVEKNDKWLIFSSDSWIKGTEDAISYANENSLDYEVVGGLEYDDFLMKMAQSRGLVFFPRGHDTCPRMIIEAKLLGCELITNDLVQHKEEPWFAGSVDKIYEYLSERATIFWSTLNEFDCIPTAKKSKKENQNHFTFVIPAYNCVSWVKTNIKSALEQDYDNFEVIYIDDASTDDTKNELKNIKNSRLKIISNKENKKALYNIYHAVQESRPDTIVILLDGDDWLSNNNVLSHLNEVYDDNVWVTAGSYIEWPTGRVVQAPTLPETLWEGNIRHIQASGHPNLFSHMRTFRKTLFDKIKKEDLLDDDGKFYSCTFDRALMYPMVEMSGPDHYVAVQEVLYVYNRQNPLSVDLVNRSQQLKIEHALRNKKPYTRVEL
tara:strand:+ start:1409 stop:3031 length:1623 start_codon:yes stop_codon:yes gene_type:complete